MTELIAIIDFGSQYTQLIARRVRELNVYCEIFTPKVTAKEIMKRNPKGIILSGGPASVYAHRAPKCDPKIFDLDLPTLGICYGMQLACKHLGGRVGAAKSREYGRAELRMKKKDPLLSGLPKHTVVWMSHGDRVENVSRDFQVLATTKNCPLAVVRHKQRPIYGVQFHPEVHHTPQGKKVLQNFLRKICKCHMDWKMKDYIRSSVKEIRETVGPKSKVLCALSGGVDSSVAATLVHKAIGDRLRCVFVDNGLLRLNERQQVKKLFADRYHLKLQIAKEEKLFLRKLRGVSEPERKRKIIGHTFIDVFKRYAKKTRGAEFLLQGTLAARRPPSRRITTSADFQRNSASNFSNL
jgi:GMP synthase (glutamine-hydrolysing)